VSDPLNDLERRVDRLASKVDLADAMIRADIDAIRADIERLKSDHLAFVPLIRYLPVERAVFGVITLVVVAVVTSVIALVVRK
jgi:hypothetical protein